MSSGATYQLDDGSSVTWRQLSDLFRSHVEDAQYN